MNNGWALVSRMGAVGDNLIASTVCRPLKRMGYKVEMLCGKPTHVVFQHNPYIDKLTAIDAERDLPRDDPVKYQMWFAHRGAEAEWYVNLGHSVEMTHSVFPTQGQFWWPPEKRRRHCAGNYLETAHDLARVPYDFGPLFFASEAEKEQAMMLKMKVRASNRRLVAWVLCGSRIDRHHPKAAPLAIARLIRECNAAVMVTAAPVKESFEDARDIMSRVIAENGTDEGFILATSPDTSLVWSLRRVLSQLLFCDLVIGPDTGPMWAVALEPVPKIMMLSNMSQENVTKHWLQTITLHADPMRVPCYPCQPTS
jgi:ADP-heptose:LPS heptosyltransferase